MKLAWKQIVVAFLFGGIVGFAGAWSGGGRMAQRHCATVHVEYIHRNFADRHCTADIAACVRRCGSFEHCKRLRGKCFVQLHKLHVLHVVFGPRKNFCG